MWRWCEESELRRRRWRRAVGTERPLPGGRWDEVIAVIQLGPGGDRDTAGVSCKSLSQGYCGNMSTLVKKKKKMSWTRFYWDLNWICWWRHNESLENTEQLFFVTFLEVQFHKLWIKSVQHSQPPGAPLMRPAGLNINHAAHFAQPPRKCTALDKSLSKHFSFSLPSCTFVLRTLACGGQRQSEDVVSLAPSQDTFPPAYMKRHNNPEDDDKVGPSIGQTATRCHGFVLNGDKHTPKNPLTHFNFVPRLVKVHSGDLYFASQKTWDGCFLTWSLVTGCDRAFSFALPAVEMRESRSTLFTHCCLLSGNC